MPFPQPRYLGDGVYASFDGFHIWLAVKNHDNQIIALDPEVFQALLKFSNEIEEEYQRLNESEKITLTSDVTKQDEPDATNS